MNKVYLLPGEWHFSEEETLISTIFGSCVGVALYDLKLQSGGLNHYLLPTLNKNDSPSTRYGDYAIEKLIKTMRNKGSEVRSLQAKIFGGADVLSGVDIGAEVGRLNLEMAWKILNHRGIPVVDSDVGGEKGRKISLNTKTFEIRLQYIGEETKVRKA